MHPAEPPALLLNLFGVPSLVLAGERLRISLQRAYGLMAMLALERRPISRDQAARMLWPEAAAAVGLGRLRRLIYELEARCGRALIDSHERSISFAAGALRCEALEFRSLAQAMIAGTAVPPPQADIESLAERACEPLLDGLTFGSDEFDDWVRMQRIEHVHLLTRMLACLAEHQRAQGCAEAAIGTAERLLAFDPYAEPSYVLLMALAADARDGAGVDAAFMRCADALRAEFGTKPAPATEQAYLQEKERAAALAHGRREAPSSPITTLPIRFATGKHGSVAYATVGEGGEALVMLPGFVSHIEIGWEHPGIREAIGRLARRFTVVVFDRRGVGLSERLGEVSTVESAADDVLTVLAAARIGRAWLFGSSEGGPAAIHIAAQHPQGVSGLILFGSLARGSRDADYPWALRGDSFDHWMDSLIAGWGGPADIQTFAPTLRDDPETCAWWARMLRQSASPASMRAVLKGLREMDVRPLLPRITAPTLVMHRRGDRAVRFEAGEHLARSIGRAEFLPLQGDSHWWWTGDTDAVIDAIESFAAASAARAGAVEGGT
ncbi:alpha/beta fold hydrolase [Ideonella azotifigens]|uniref:Alpha/beta fold hydrolase n=1 Tax=Ideonella azotifigens TaxID=513160 RepID=A0ABN1KAV1_9BURK|nr:alpha/beta hydrolase [Ideonella azotifigens]MCD2338757.1 alpha/beta fold hydrolase [Ideonella azotifigens]